MKSTTLQLDWQVIRLIAAVVVALSLMLLAGCAETKKTPFETCLEELDVEASLNSADELLLGTYNVASALPVPEGVVSDDEMEEPEPLWVQVKFELYAIVAPQDRKAVEAACERHRGMLDDAVVTICREASKEELDDSRWATLKSRLIDAIRPILGDDRLKHLSFAEFGWEPI